MIRNEISQENQNKDCGPCSHSNSPNFKLASLSESSDKMLAYNHIFFLKCFKKLKKTKIAFKKPNNNFLMRQENIKRAVDSKQLFSFHKPNLKTYRMHLRV